MEGMRRGGEGGGGLPADESVYATPPTNLHWCSGTNVLAVLPRFSETEQSGTVVGSMSFYPIEPRTPHNPHGNTGFSQWYSAQLSWSKCAPICCRIIAGGVTLN